MKILILTTRPLHNGPRMIREIEALKGSHQIIATGLTPPHDSNIEFINSDRFRFRRFEYAIGTLLRILAFNKVYLGKYFRTQKRINRLLKETSPDLVIVHEAAYIPYLFTQEKKFKVVFNAHEYHPLEIEGNLKWTRTWGVIYSNIYSQYLSKVDLLINVNKEIADKCEREFGVKSLVIPNAAKYFPPKNIQYIAKRPLRFIHHGVPNPDRKLEIMIDAFRTLGAGYHLDLMLVQNKSEYYSSLLAMAKDLPNVRLIKPVAFHEIIEYISEYDLGVYSLAPASFNNQMALPNKFFEFIQARLPMVIGPSPVMANLVNKYQIGEVAEDFSSTALVKIIDSLEDRNLILYRSNLEKAAEELSMEKFDRVLLEKINTLN